MGNNGDIAADVKRIFRNLDDVIQRVQGDPAGIIPASSTGGHYADRADLMGTPPGGDEIDPELLHLINEGSKGLEKIRSKPDETPDLTPVERIGIEAIIQLEGRPAIMIKDDGFEEPPDEWSVLKQHRATIESNIPRVGRVEVEGHPRLDWVGTGFLVAPNVIMTNRHVAVEFSERKWICKWKFKPDMESRIDFKEEVENNATAEFDFAEVIGIHPRLDLALLRLEPQDSRGPSEPLVVGAEAPADFMDRQVYTVGYPAWDGRRNEPDVMRRIFSDTYNVKRLQPGHIIDEKIRGMVFHHDCSTLGGNSGSCVIDLESGHVLGLHYGGRYREKNNAIPLWKLHNNRLLRKAGVNFA